MFLAMKIDFDEILQSIVHWLLTEGVKLVIGVILLFFFFKIINTLAHIIKKRMEKRNTDKLIISIVNFIIRKGLKIILILLFLGYVGFDTAGIGAIISSVGIAIGLALQGSLGNFAGGVVILLMRPFKIGDFIEAQQNSGTVDRITIFYTYLISPDNKVVMIPNGILANGNIINYSAKETRRLDLKFAIAYKENFEKAKEVIKEVCNKNELILTTPLPFINVLEYTDRGTIILVRVWVNTPNYWPVNFWLQEEIKKALDSHNIDMSYTQVKLHLEDKTIK